MSVELHPPVQGSLVFVIGASGAGKDSLISAADRLQSDDQYAINIAPRYVTRAKRDNSEDIEITSRQFSKQYDANIFLFAWQAHGYHYGISRAVLSLLKHKTHVLINGSRAYAEQARVIYPALKIAAIEADSISLHQRLNNRGREDKQAINERLVRNARFAQALNCADIVINNNQELESSAQDLIAWLALQT